MTYRKLVVALVATSSLFTALPSPLAAQTAPTPVLAGHTTDSGDPKAPEAVKLDPFLVNVDNDNGYEAVDSLAGGRIQTQLSKTPAPVSVLTRQFLDDIGATSFTTAAIWTTNAFLQSNGTSNFSEFQVNFRGVGSGLQTVNYFTFQNQTDEYNTERFEFTRGPNSLLFGNGNLSGIPTTFTKVPRFSNFTQIQAKFDSEGMLRGTMDINREALNGRVALRINLLGQQDPKWEQHARNDRQSADIAGIIKVSKSADIRFEAESGKMERSWADQNFLENYSFWDNKTVYAGNGTTALASTAGTGLTFQAGNATNDYLVYDPSHPENGVMNEKGFYTTTGTNFATLPSETRGYVANFPVGIAKGINLNPANDLALNKYNMTTLYFEKRFGDSLFLQLALNHDLYDRDIKGANWQTLRRDVDQYLPSGAPNPNFNQVYADAQPTAQRQWNPQQDVRLSGSYELDTSWMTQRFSLLAGENRGSFFLDNYALVRSNNAAVTSLTNAQNAVVERYYINEPSLPNYTEGPLSSNGVTTEMFNNSHQAQPSRLRYAQLAAVGSYFHDTLSTILGLRTDYSRRATYTSTVNAANALVFSGGPLWNHATTGSAGFVYYPIPWVGPFANYSESFALPALGNPLFDGVTQPGPTSGRSKEAGLQFKVLSGQIQGRIGYYDTFESGRVINAVDINQINGIWNAMGLTSNAFPASYTPRDTQTLDAKGLEAEFTANIFHQWRTLFNFALPKTYQNNSLPGEKAYYAANIAAWEAATTSPALSTGAQATVQSNLLALQSAIQGTNDGRANNSTMKYRANVYSTYTFDNPLLRGFGVGAGINLFGPQIIGNVLNQPFSYIYMREYFLLSGHISYIGQIGKLRYRAQINVINAANDTRLIYNSVIRPAGLTYDVNGSYYFNNPRRVVFSTTFDF